MCDVVMVVTTVVPTKSECEGILRLQLLTKQLMCTIHLIKCGSIECEYRKRSIQTILEVFPNLLIIFQYSFQTQSWIGKLTLKL